ncbi:hypothetical protein ANN_12128 [Periplaneta americana]|uniref:Uncharacterized protein n=1 Tax=Periplaneta americana TaxID=6978 RepID=A0ABQ8T8V6_PERAM|nr:hypothetical protein ANN_12128 [Periplaneta americana]
MAGLCEGGNEPQGSLKASKPIWMYGCGKWGSASNSQIRRIQTIQNRVLRLIVDAPWYIRNDNLHKDLNVSTVESTLRSSYIRLHHSMVNHQNELLNTIPEQLLPPRQIRRLKRKRHSDLLYED